MPGDPEARLAFHLCQGLLQPAGFDLDTAPALFALNMVMMMVGTAAHEAHDLVLPQDALRPALLNKTLEVSIDRGNARTISHSAADVLHRQGAIRAFQGLQQGLALGGLFEADGPQVRGGAGVGTRVGGRNGVGHAFEDKPSDPLARYPSLNDALSGGFDMKRKQIWMLAGGAALIVVVGIAASTGDKAQPVQVAKASRQRIISKVSANGKVQAVKKVDISANVMGKVTRLAVKEGDVVKAGQFLLEIDPARSRASVMGVEASSQALAQDLQSAQARLEQAKKDFQRAEANRKAGIISQAEYDQVRTTLTTAERTADSANKRLEQGRANVTEARVSLNYTTITAPMDGVVTARRIEQGETAVMGLQSQPGTVLLTISDMSKVEAEMEVDEASIPAVKLKQNAQVRIDAYPNQTFEGEVTEVGGSPILKTSANEAIKFKVKVWIKNPPLTIKPGLSAQADIFTGNRENVLAVPIQSLVTREIKVKPGETAKPGAPRDEEGVYLLEGGKTKFVPIKTGLMGDLEVEITEGLKGEETVITGPFRLLRDFKGGEKVSAEKAKKPGKKDESK